MKSTYKVISASAGSGKTYTLVQRLLMICLSQPHQADAIRHILALTFTNKAANEMKERILKWLGKFVANNYMECPELLDIQAKFKENGQNIPLEELHRRAKNVLDYILHHYSTLNISTIDKFNTKLIRSFSYELGLAQNFNLEIQPEPYLIEAVDQMLSQIGENKKVSEAFMDFVEYNLDNEKRVNLSQELYQSAKEFVKDIHYKRLLDNKDFDWKSYETLKNNIRKDIKDLRENSLQIAQKAIDLMKSRNLEIEDFAGGKQRGIGKFFYDIIKFFNKERSGFPLPSNESSALETFEKGASSKGKHKENEILDILNFLLENRQTIIQNHILSHKKERVLRALLPLRVNKDIQDELAKIEEEKDLVLLSKFNILINENLKNEPSAFIYEKVGTQYLHYFFDEFQDTSALQWQNFLPLRDHTISSDDTSFTLVGDPKQSIYRFRGGDSQLMLDIINAKEYSPVPAQKETLADNYRSAKNIVKFNNELYQYLSKNLGEDHQNIFGEDAQQNPKSKIEGRVKVNLIENSNKDDFYADVVEKMREDIQQCLDNGFSFSDICILCRGNFDIFNYSQLLGHQEVEYKGEEVFIKTISDKGLTLNLSKTINALIHFLQWKAFPDNKSNMVMMLYFLNKLERIKINDFSTAMLEILELKNQEEIFDFLQKKYNLNLSPKHLPRLNLYNFIEYFTNEFSVKGKETDFILNFLELIYNFSQHAGMTIKDFLKFWEEEGQNTSIQASESVDAIQIMTIHKAKGLEFPVVFLPMENKTQDGKFTEWYDLQDNEYLNAVNIAGFGKELEVYDEDIANFNQENVNKNLIDRICVQYVATTRPVEQLFLYLEKANASANHLEILEFVETKNIENQDSFDLFPIDENPLKKQISKQEKQHNTMGILSVSSPEQSFQNIKIATPSKSYQNRKEQVRMGILIHDILAKIISKNDVEKVLEHQLLSGNITQKERAFIAEKIQKILVNEDYAPYFSEDVLEVLNEREIFITSEAGNVELYRPDRIVKTSEGYVVIDFKTGKENEKKHKKQIETYQSALEKLGKNVVGSHIIYLD
ncbi:MAG: UvrD-helicase domain-containing protein [Flavobacteriaceae bacterium]|nr:UvrD-helicase domain-containing protein [Flavobacteriaceae bacterium]